MKKFEVEKDDEFQGRRFPKEKKKGNDKTVSVLTAVTKPRVQDEMPGQVPLPRCFPGR